MDALHQPTITASIRRVDVGEGLALVFLVGPGSLAREGLSLATPDVESGRPILWHRVDRDGPDLSETLARAGLGRRALVLVHGFERLLPALARDLAGRLNMLRDRLAGRAATIVIWLPEALLEELTRHIPDLFAWRALFRRLPGEVIEPSRETRRMRELAARTLEAAQIARVATHRWPQDVLLDEIYVPLRIREADHPSSEASLDIWAASTRRGLLTGPPGAGATTSLARRVGATATGLLDGSRPGPVPVLASAPRLAARAEQGPVWDALSRELSQTGIQVSSQELAALATTGDLLLLVDGVVPEVAELVWDVLEGATRDHPGLDLLVTGTPTVCAPPQWKQAELLPLDDAAVGDFVERRVRASWGTAHEIVSLPGESPRLTSWLQEHEDLLEVVRLPARLAIVVQAWLVQGQLTRLAALESILAAALATGEVGAARLGALSESAWECAVAGTCRFDDADDLARSVPYLVVSHGGGAGGASFADPLIRDHLAARAVAEQPIPTALARLLPWWDDTSRSALVVLALALLVRRGDLRDPAAVAGLPDALAEAVRAELVG